MQVFFGKKHLGLKISETSEISWGSDLFVKIGNHKTTMHLRPLQFKNTPNKAIEYPHVHEEIHLQVISLFSLLSSFAVVFRYYTTTPAAKKIWEFWMNIGFRSCNGWIFLKADFRKKTKTQLIREQTNCFKIGQFIYFYVSIENGWSFEIRQLIEIYLSDQKKVLTLCEQRSQTLKIPCPLVHEGVP